LRDPSQLSNFHRFFANLLGINFVEEKYPRGSESAISLPIDILQNRNIIGKKTINTEFSYPINKEGLADLFKRMDDIPSPAPKNEITSLNQRMLQNYFRARVGQR
jgi:hypothetical protein